MSNVTCAVVENERRGACPVSIVRTERAEIVGIGNKRDLIVADNLNLPTRLRNNGPEVGDEHIRCRCRIRLDNQLVAHGMLTSTKTTTSLKEEGPVLDVRVSRTPISVSTAMAAD